MERFFEDLQKKVPVIAVAEATDPSKLLPSADYDGRYDPHVWMDPTLWAEVVEEVRRALSEARPDLSADFATNAGEYQDEIAALATYAREALAAVPEEARVLVTAHDAFGYFGRAFDFDVIGIQGISTNSEAGLNRVSELVDLLVSRSISAVFVETSVSDRNVRALIEGAAARDHEVMIGGALYSDAMGEEGTYEGTYIGMIDHNVTTIARALGADVAPGGMAGKLAQGS